MQTIAFRISFMFCYHNLFHLKLFFSKCRPCRSSWEVEKHIRRHSYIVLTPIDVAQSLTIYPTWLDKLLHETKKFCWNTFLQTIAFRISFMFFYHNLFHLKLFFSKCRPCRSSWEVEKHIRRHSYIVLTPIDVAQSLTIYPTWLDKLLHETKKFCWNTFLQTIAFRISFMFFYHNLFHLKLFCSKCRPCRSSWEVEKHIRRHSYIVLTPIDVAQSLTIYPTWLDKLLHETKKFCWNTFLQTIAFRISFMFCYHNLFHLKLFFSKCRPCRSSWEVEKHIRRHSYIVLTPFDVAQSLTIYPTWLDKLLHETKKFCWNTFLQTITFRISFMFCYHNLFHLKLFFSKCRPCRSSWEVEKHIRRHSYIVLTPIDVAQSLTIYPTWLDKLLHETKKFCWNTFLQTIAFRISFMFFYHNLFHLKLFFSKCRPCRSSWEVEKHIRRHSYIVLTPIDVAQSLTIYPTWLDKLLHETKKFCWNTFLQTITFRISFMFFYHNLFHLKLFFSKCRPCRSSWEVEKHIRRHSYIVLTPIDVAQSLTIYPTWVDKLLHETKKFCWNTFLQTIAFRISFMFFYHNLFHLKLFCSKCRPCRSSWEVEKHIRRHSYIVLTPIDVAQSLTIYPTWVDKLLHETKKFCWNTFLQTIAFRISFMFFYHNLFHLKLFFSKCRPCRSSWEVEKHIRRHSYIVLTPIDVAQSLTIYPTWLEKLLHETKKFCWNTFLQTIAFRISFMFCYHNLFHLKLFFSKCRPCRSSWEVEKHIRRHSYIVLTSIDVAQSLTIYPTWLDKLLHETKKFCWNTFLQTITFRISFMFCYHNLFHLKLFFSKCRPCRSSWEVEKHIRRHSYIVLTPIDVAQSLTIYPTWLEKLLHETKKFCWNTFLQTITFRISFMFCYHNLFHLKLFFSKCRPCRSSWEVEKDIRRHSYIVLTSIDVAQSLTIYSIWLDKLLHETKKFCWNTFLQTIAFRISFMFFYHNLFHLKLFCSKCRPCRSSWEVEKHIRRHSYIVLTPIDVAQSLTIYPIWLDKLLHETKKFCWNTFLQTITFRISFMFFYHNLFHLKLFFSKCRPCRSSWEVEKHIRRHSYIMLTRIDVAQSLTIYPTWLDKLLHETKKFCWNTFLQTIAFRISFMFCYHNLFHLKLFFSKCRPCRSSWEVEKHIRRHSYIVLTSIDVAQSLTIYPHLAG